ncbi:hypothetical protein ACLOJK_016941 [Asimina triloba]
MQDLAILEFFQKFTDSISADLQFVIDDISTEDSSAIGVSWHLGCHWRRDLAATTVPTACRSLLVLIKPSNSSLSAGTFETVFIISYPLGLIIQKVVLVHAAIPLK